MSQPKLSSFIFSLFLLATGIGIGYCARPLILPIIWPEFVDQDMAQQEDSHAGHQHAPSEQDDGHSHGSSENVIELLDQTIKNMGLVTGKFEKRDYARRIQIPAEFVERLPEGRNSITPAIGCRVEKVHIAPGEAIRPGQLLFELVAMDDDVSTAQVALLNTLAEEESLQTSLERNRRLAEKDIIAGKTIIEQEIELRQLDSRKKAFIQELLLRGLSRQQVNNLVENKVLLRTLEIRAPDVSASMQTQETSVFTVEDLQATVGKTFQRGELLCELIHHGRLFVKGMAFESDIEGIANAQQQGWNLELIVGEGDETLVKDDLELHSIDNHVDESSQTYSVFVAMDNEVTASNMDAQNRKYVQWRFRSGQRAHLTIPVEYWKDQVVIPRKALVEEGVETFVFRQTDHTHPAPDGGETYAFIKTPVKVIYKDVHHAVIEDDISLDLYENYALNQSYQLNLALKRASGETSGGHSHSHGGHTHSH